MTDQRTAVLDVVDVTDPAVAPASDLREQMLRDEATARALREYLRARPSQD